MCVCLCVCVCLSVCVCVCVCLSGWLFVCLAGCLFVVVCRSTLKPSHLNVIFQLKEYEGHVEAKDIKIKELETVLETSRESETQLSDLVQSLRARVHELEEQVGSIQTVSNRGEYTISTLQKDLQEANDKIVQLETRIR